MSKRENPPFNVDAAETLTARLGVEVAYNRVTKRIDVNDHTGILNGSADRLRALSDYLLVNIREDFRFVSRDAVDSVLRLLADRHAFNPVLTLVRPYENNHGNAIKELCDDVLHLPKDDRISRTYVKKMLMQALAMTLKTERNNQESDLFNYGADGMLVLVGAQGIGKSRLVHRLALGYGGEITLSQFQDETDLYSICNGVFVGEVSELEHSLRPSNRDFFKKWITSPSDTYRPKYGRQPEKVSRTASFVATANTQSFLQDKTGNRRFWVIQIEKPLNEKRLNDLQDDVFLRAFGEALAAIEKDMQSFRLTNTERTQTELRNIGYMTCSPELTDLILSLLDSVDQSHFTIDDLKAASNQLAGVSSVLVGRELQRMPEITAKRTSQGRFYTYERGACNAVK